MFNTKRNIITILSIVIFISIPSCGVLDPVLDRIDEAISQVAITRKAVLMDSRNWKIHLSKLEEKISNDVSKVIEEDLTDFAEDFVQTSGTEVRCEIDFVESKILGYLDAVLSALKTIRKKAEKDGKLDESLEVLLSNMIDSRKIISPWTCHTAKVTNFTKSGKRLVLEKEEKKPELIGFALRRPLNEYTVDLVNRDMEVVKSVQGDKCLSDPTPYVLRILTDKLPLNTNHAFISVIWNNSKLSETEINIVESVEPTPAEQMAVFNIKLHSKSEKDKRISLNIKLLKNNIPIKEISQYLRGGKLASNTEDEIRWILNSVYSDEDLFTIKIQMEKLGRTGKIIDKKPVISGGNLYNPNLFNLYKKKGYVKEGNHYVLYEFPPTILGDWQGDISFRLSKKSGHKDFRAIPFKFNDGYVDAGKNSEFNADWNGNGTPIP